MSDTRTTIDNMLKYVYLDGIVDQFYKKHFLLKKLKKRSTGGKGVVIPLATARVHGHGSRAESGTLPTADGLNPDTTTVTPKFHYARYLITGPAMTAARNKSYAFVEGLSAGLRAVGEGFTDDIERQLFGNGSAILTLCGTTSASNTVVLDSTTKGGGFGAQNLQPGMLVDIQVTNGGTDHTNGGDITIDSVDYAAHSFDFTGTTVTTSGSHSIRVANNRDASGIYEMMGLAGIVTNVDPGSQITNCGAGSLQAKAIATNAWWKAAVKNNSGVNIDLTHERLHDLLIEIERISGMAEGIDYLLCRPEIFKQYGLLMTPDKRYGPDPMTMEGGFKYLTFSGIPLLQSFSAWPNRIYALNMDHLFMVEENKPHWDETTGSILERNGSTDAFNATLVYYANLGTDKRCAHGVLEDVSH